MPARPWTAVAVAVALLLLPACSARTAGGPRSAGPSDGSSTESNGPATRSTGPASSAPTGSSGAHSPPQTTAPQTTAPQTTAPQTTTPRSTGSAETIAYTPWGPDDPPIPGEYAALAATADRPPNCGDVVRQSPPGRFWTLVADVCRALTAGGPWPRDTTVPSPPAAETPYQACLDDELTAMIERALHWHARHRADRPRVVYPRSSSISPCQFRIYEARPLTADELASAAHDPGVAGIAVVGTGIADPASVTVDGQSVEPRGDFDIPAPGTGLDGFVVLTTAGPRIVRVAVTTARGTIGALVRLPPQDTSATGPPTATSPS